MTLSALPSRPAPGDVVEDRYELLARLAVTRVGSVWAGHDHLLRRDVAVKVSDASRTAAEELAHEARLAATVTHRSLPRIHDLTHAHGRAWMMTELLRGPTLADHVRAHGPLDADRAGVLAGHLVAAISTLHEAGLVHRGVHASTIVLEEDRPVLIGFGSASTAGSRFADYDALHSALRWACADPSLLAPAQTPSVAQAA